jgi:hypothetical protein
MFKPAATFLCLTWISNARWRGLFLFNDLRWEVAVRFVDIGRNVDHHCLNFLFIIIDFEICYYFMNTHSSHIRTSYDIPGHMYHISIFWIEDCCWEANSLNGSSWQCGSVMVAIVYLVQCYAICLSHVVIIYVRPFCNLH